MKKLLCGVALLVFTVACTVGHDFVKPAAPDAGRYTDNELPAQTTASDTAFGTAQHFAAGKNVPREWWKEFRSAKLDSLVQLALAANPDVQAAKASLAQAQEQMLSERGFLFPQADVKFAPSRQRSSPASAGFAGSPSVYNLYNATVDVSYAVDVFGATSRAVEALQAQVDLRHYEMQATYLTLTANVVTAAIAEASLREQIEETKDIITIQREQAELLNKQYTLGAIPKNELLEQQALVAQTETTLPPLEKQLAQKRNLLAVLVGKLPFEGVEQSFDLASLHLPQELPVTLPSELVQQRPDIQASEAQLHAASAEVGVATAAMLPRITLAGSYGGAATDVHSVFTPQTMVWNLGANLMQPLFNGGRLLHAKRGKEAAFDKAQAQYRSVVLQAFQNVADALHALHYDANALAAQVKAERAAADSFNLTRQQYEAGAIAYTQMLDTQRMWQQSRIGLVQAQATRLADTAALYQALGGGWGSEAKPASFVPAVALTPPVADKK